MKFRDILNEKTGDKEAYQKFFDKTLKKYGVSSPDELSAEDKKKFFDEVDNSWKSDVEEMSEASFSVSQFASKDYQDYEYGKPIESANAAVKELQKIEEALKVLNVLSKQAGSPLSPGFTRLVKSDVNNLISKNLK